MPQCKDHLGNNYSTLADMARAYGLVPKSLVARLECGWKLKKRC